jgi:hypothetical protein
MNAAKKETLALHSFSITDGDNEVVSMAKEPFIIVNDFFLSHVSFIQLFSAIR